MFGMGSLNPLNSVSSLALGALTGGSSLILQGALQIGANIAKQALQTVGQQLGVPQYVIDQAQGMVDLSTGNPVGALGEFAQSANGLNDVVAGIVSQLGGSPSDIGAAQRDSHNAAQQMVENIQKQMREGGIDEEGGAVGSVSAKGARGESFLMKLARVMGKVIDSKMNDQMELAKKMDQAKANKDESTIGTDSAKMQALNQEVTLLTTALNTAMKSIGEGSTTLSRKN